MSVMHALKLAPRRTVRLVLFTNEENGLAGAFAYAKAHASETHVAALETDAGAGEPVGFGVEGTEEAAAFIRDLAAPLGSLGAKAVTVGDSGADLIPLVESGVPGISFRPDESRYFDIHHTDADTLDKVDPAFLTRQAALIAGLIWQIAEAERTVPRKALSPNSSSP
jgi:Zn-dependent M28 family amino/carboxypeptidase